jgi:zinc protease
VGDFDPGEVRPLLTAMLADWKAAKPYARLPNEAFTNVRGGQQVVQTPDKANAVYAAGHVVAMNDSHPDYPALVLGNFIFGGGSLSSRLGDRVRQQEGLSYGIVSYYSAEPLDDRASITVYAISNPQNTAKVSDVIVEEFEKLLRDGITEEELERAKQGYLQAQSVRRTNDGALGGILAGCSYADRTMEYHADFEKRIAALTADDVMQAWRRHIDPKRLVVVTAGDFEKAADPDGQGQ